MAATIKGLGVVWSVGSQTYTGGIVSHATTAQSTPQSITLNRTSDKSMVKGLDGEVLGVIFSGFMKTASLSLVPSASTVAAAKTALDTYCPAPGVSVTMVDSIAGLLDDNWNVTSATQNRTVDGVATVDLELEAGDETTELAGTAL